LSSERKQKTSREKQNLLHEKEKNVKQKLATKGRGTLIGTITNVTSAWVFIF
jgi:hypothetical protein